MVWLITGLLSLAALFVVVLPGAVLVAAVLVNLRRSPEPEVQLCDAADVTDPAAKPCFAFEGTRFCERHGQLDQRAS
jgi:hypothetical protein